MTDNPFARLAVEVVLRGRRIRALGPFASQRPRGEPRTWTVYLMAGGAGTQLDLAVLEGYDHDEMLPAVRSWEEFALALSDPLIALGYLL